MGVHGLETGRLRKGLTVLHLPPQLIGGFAQRACSLTNQLLAPLYSVKMSMLGIPLILLTGLGHNYEKRLNTFFSRCV